MEPLLIAGLTILALVALMLEYHARTFTRAFEAARSASRKRHGGEVVPAVSPHGRVRPVEFKTREARETGRSLLPAPSSRAPLKAAMPPGSAAEASTRASGGGRGGQERTARGIDNTVDELERLVLALGSAHGLGTATEMLLRVEERLSEYDLDDLMEIADRDLSVNVITFYRDVAGTIHEIRACLGRQPSDWTAGGLRSPSESEPDGLQSIPANAVARGRLLAARLRGKELRRFAAETSAAVAIPS